MSNSLAMGVGVFETVIVLGRKDIDWEDQDIDRDAWVDLEDG